MHKLSIFGTAKIGRCIYIGTGAFCITKNVFEKSDKGFLGLLTNTINKLDYRSLVNEYKKVQQKYYPEKDILTKKLKEKNNDKKNSVYISGPRFTDRWNGKRYI